ncbi:MAG: sigma-54 dependent transcriptional regulator [Candidatus Saganbacteria bacterium]|nr:sigma-54 dependent transcriptional regulator [Candidatus Saganbacteria bacterium]
MAKTKLNILLVDDEHDMITTLNSILMKKYNPIPVMSGKDALNKITTEKIDLVLLDIRMPEMDGVKALKKIKELDQDLEVIMITAVKDVKSAVECMKLGAYDYITKPFEVDELLSLIDKVLEKRSLIKENIYLKSVLKDGGNFEDLIGQTQIINDIFKLIDKVAKTESTVLITGESGTGKELVAKALHNRSKRSDKPFVVVNCAAIPDNLLESELFGYEKGAFTGAGERKLGKFELADQGTIFLDEIGEVTPAIQVKFLRVIQDCKIDRIGGTKPIPVNVRIIAATNIDFKKHIEEKKFREDLYYRLNVIPIAMPPLRERKEDIPLFVNYFLDKYNKILNKKIKGFTPEAINALLSYRWPGNVRELQNLIERAVTLGNGEYISEKDLPIESPGKSINIKCIDLNKATEDFEKDYIKQALIEADGNQTRAAKILKMHRTTLVSKMESLGIN